VVLAYHGCSAVTKHKCEAAFPGLTHCIQVPGMATLSSCAMHRNSGAVLDTLSRIPPKLVTSYAMSEPAIVNDMEKSGDTQYEVDPGVDSLSTIDPVAERRLLRKIDLHMVVCGYSYRVQCCIQYVALTREAHRVAHVPILKPRPYVL
jgi:hypothetical protein